MSNLLQFSLSEALALLEKKEFSTKELVEAYINAIEKNNLAVLRGYSVDKKQKIVRDVINSVMCNYYLDIENIAEKHKSSISEIVDIIDFSEDKFQDFIDDNLLTIENYKLTIFKKGRLFTRNIAMRFDPLIKQNVGTYSNTI